MARFEFRSRAMRTPQETTTEVVNVLDCLSALSADLSCKCTVPPHALVLSSNQVKEACAAIDEAVESLKRLLVISVAEGGGPPSLPPAAQPR